MPQAHNRISGALAIREEKVDHRRPEFWEQNAWWQLESLTDLCEGEVLLAASPARNERNDPPPADWASELAAAVRALGATATSTRLLALETRVATLERALSRAEAGPPFNVVIATLAPSALKLKRAIPALVRSNGDEHIASFVDANIGMSGETMTEAVQNLKEAIAMTFEHYRSLPPTALGPAPARQLAVLRDFIEEPTN